MCPHGDPRPNHCALCRHEVLFPLGQTKAPQTADVKPVRPVPRPPWFEATVERARLQARREREA